MAEAAEKTPYPDYILALTQDELSNEIDNITQSFLHSYGSAFGYRCSRCNRLSVWHPDGDIDECNQPDSTNDKYLESLRDQLRSLNLIQTDLNEAQRTRDKYEKAKAEIARLQRETVKFQNVEKDFETYRNRTQQALLLARESVHDVLRFQPEIAKVKAHELDCDELLAKFSEYTDSTRRLWKCLDESRAEGVDEEVGGLLGGALTEVFKSSSLSRSQQQTPYPNDTKVITESSVKAQLL